MAYVEVYQLPDEIWHKITPKPGNPEAGLLCPRCADIRAREQGVVLYWEAGNRQFPTQKKENGMKDFRKELSALINMHSKENGSDTPDFILANYLCACLEAFDNAVTRRTKWHDRGSKDNAHATINLSNITAKEVPVPNCKK